MKRTARAMARRAPLKFLLLVALAALLGASSAVLLSGVLADDPPGETKSERADRVFPRPTYANQAEADAAAEKGKQEYAARTDALVKEFMATGRALDDLRPAFVSTQAFPAGTLEERLKNGSAVRATVGTQRVELAGYVVSELLISESVTGGLRARETVLIAHTGGPRPQGIGEPDVLLMHANNPIPERGKEYFFVLREPQQSQDGKYPVLYSAWGAGHQFEIVGGVLHDRVEGGQRAEPDGKSLAEARLLVAAAAASVPE
ncbi:MAG: hypothetical protein ACR2HN_07470 [Tepidiformaceae bacterium]